MAKGFTVKAKSPVKKKAPVAPQYDYAKAREMIKGKPVSVVHTSICNKHLLLIHT